MSRGLVSRFWLETSELPQRGSSDEVARNMFSLSTSHHVSSHV